ncbi:MAG: hypothetical protein LDL31_13095 [Prosthecobacter sp.]|jgi:hypothetical protein|nr:hypothetical protein [Prosthecobacter sp.]
MESDPQGSREELTPRPPEPVDVARLCAELNKAGARYVVVGGYAIIQAGFARFTEDLDLLIETTPENECQVLSVLGRLPDGAAKQVRVGEVDQYGVVRVSDEILVDLMKSGCGVTYADAIQDAVWSEIDGIRIPFASKKTLWKMKQTLRSKDDQDRLFLAQALQAEGIPLDPPLKPSHDPLAKMPNWLKWLLAKIFR